MKIRADLHNHSTCSDGEFTPSQLVDMAKKANLDYFSLTDHDGVYGIDEALQRGKEVGVNVIRGIELSCYFSRDVHILGYGIDYKNKKLNEKLQEVQSQRVERNFQILKKLEDFNIHIERQELENYEVGTVVGRTQIGALMVRHGYVSTIKDAFDYYLGSGKKAFIAPLRLTPKEAIEMIGHCGGKAVLAHPNQLCMSKPDTFDYINELKSYGLFGIESYYYTHSEKDVKFYEEVAKNLSLVSTAGSDFHGEHRSNVMGVVPREMELEVIELLK